MDSILIVRKKDIKDKEGYGAFARAARRSEEHGSGSDFEVDHVLDFQIIRQTADRAQFKRQTAAAPAKIINGLEDFKACVPCRNDPWVFETPLEVGFFIQAAAFDDFFVGDFDAVRRTDIEEDLSAGKCFVDGVRFADFVFFKIVENPAALRAAQRACRYCPAVFIEKEEQ